MRQTGLKITATALACFLFLALPASAGFLDKLQKGVDLYNKKEAAEEKIETGKKVTGKLRKGFSELSAQEEYYIGRSVSAKILSQYKPSNDSKRNEYINTLGQYLAWSSSRPEIYGGYHFTLIEGKDINAFAAPGGFIFVTTGLYKSLENEEQLAAVLAHEIAHVNLKHGLGAIKKSNLTQAFTLIGTEVAKQYNKEQLLELTEVFGKSIDDVVNQLVVSGYSRGQEHDADEEALRVAYKAGYNPAGLGEFLTTLHEATKGGHSGGFTSTHPPADKRIDKVKKYVKKEKFAGTTEGARTSRFSAKKL